MKDLVDVSEGTAWAAGIFLVLGVTLHPFFLFCAIFAFSLFVFLTWYDLRQRTRGPTYQYITNEKGEIVGIWCNHCGHSTRKQNDIESRYCSFCHRHHDGQSPAGAESSPPA